MAPVLVRIAAFLFAISPAFGFVNPGIGVRATVTRPAQVSAYRLGLKTTRVEDAALFHLP